MSWNSLENFLSYLKTERRYSAHTITAYQADLNQFQSFLSDAYGSISVAEVSSAMIRTFLVELMTQGKTPRSIIRKRSSLNSFFKYLIRKEELSINPVDLVVAPKAPKRLPQILRHNELDLLFESLTDAVDFPSGRDRMLLELLYGTGMRRSELINLKVSDIDQSKIKVMGKRRKERLIPLNNRIQDILPKYLEFRNELEEKDDQFLFAH